jgi:hypothetical protein
LKRNNRVCFEVEGASSIVRHEEPCHWSTRSRSIVGYGHVEILTDPEEKKRGLDIILTHYGKADPNVYDEKHLGAVVILRISIESVSCKQLGEPRKVMRPNIGRSAIIAALHLALLFAAPVLGAEQVTVDGVLEKYVKAIGGKEAWNKVLESKPTPSSKERFSFSAQTGFLVRQQSEFKTSAGNDARVDTRYLEYRAVDGLQYPHLQRFKVVADGQEIELTMKLKEIVHNEKFEDSVFSKPSP